MGANIFEMKRRSFLKLLGVSPIVPSVLMAKDVDAVDVDLGLDRLDPNAEGRIVISDMLEPRDNTYRFYINDKEVDSSRALDEYGSIRFPIEGAKKGDVCKMTSPTFNI